MPVRLCYVAVYTAKFYSYLCIRVDRVRWCLPSDFLTGASRLIYELHLTIR